MRMPSLPHLSYVTASRSLALTLLWNNVRKKMEKKKHFKNHLAQNVGFLFLSPRAMSPRPELDNIFLFYPSQSAESSEGFRFLESLWLTEPASPSCCPAFYCASFQDGGSIASCIRHLMSQQGCVTNNHKTSGVYSNKRLLLLMSPWVGWTHPFIWVIS